MFSIFIDGLFIEDDLKNIYDSKRSIDIIFEEANKNKFDRFILLQRGTIKSVPNYIKNVIVSDLTPKSIIDIIIKEAKNSENILFFDAGSPFYDYQFIEKMMERHIKFFADYTYSVGYPEGLLPTIIRKEALKEFLSLSESIDELTPNYLFDILSKDINSFDIETFLSDIDLRIYRIKFGENDIGERVLTKRCFKNLKNRDVNSIVNYLHKNLDKIYTVPYMLEIELNNKLPCKPIYYPEVAYNEELDTDFIKKLIIESKNINPKINVVFGGIGDPLLSNNIFEILEFIKDFKLNTIIETFGYNITQDLIDKLIKTNYNVIIVIKMDAYTENCYNKIFIDGNYKKVKENYDLLKKSCLKVYKSVVRILENENEIEMFIKNKEAEDLIIRKYSTFCGKLTDKKVVDLTPLERIPCFHLRREIFVNSNKKVRLCHFCLENEVGDLSQEDLETIINKLEEEYSKNSRKIYRDCCEKCDDYYLFNF